MINPGRAYTGRGNSATERNMCDMKRLGLITAKFKTNMAKGLGNFGPSTKNEMSFLFEELLCLGDETDDNFRTESESNINERGDESFRLTNITATSFRAFLERMAEAVLTL